jgi:tetratricopeptide (TPR) repeat protein
LSLALVFAIYHALPYFKAGRDYYRAEKLYKQGRYPDAIKGFESALKSGQDAKEIRLRLALAYLKDGQPTQAWPVVKDRSFDESAEFREMQGYFDRFDKAYAKIEEAHKLTDDNHSADAAKLLHEAKTIYPELQGLDEGLEDLAVSDAYERKDYDEFVRLSELRYKHYPSSGNAAGLASALACRYAIGGDPTVRAQVEDMLRTAQSMIKTDEEKKSFEEYEPRIRYRLDKREIIDKKQYDRRFRSEQPKEKS